MDIEKLVTFHEKLYFHELESREKLVTRLQFSMGMLTALVGLMAYLGSHFDMAKFEPSVWGIAFLVSYPLAALGLIGASEYFVKALCTNINYECLPTAREIEEYRGTLKKTYDDDHGPQITKERYDDFLLERLAKCSSANALLNTRRWEELHRSTVLIVTSVPLITIAGVAFVIGGFAKQAAS